MRAASDIEELIAGWDGLGVVVRFDQPTGAWVFIALHDDTLGTPVGGCRMKGYTSPSHGLRDAMRLAEGMTYKWAALDLPFGGGKSVLAVPRPLEGEDRKGLLRRFGRLLRSLEGAYETGEDLGTTPEDMAILAEESEHVMGVHRHGDELPMDPGPFTALGVFAGIRAGLRHLTGSDGMDGRSVLVQGVGDVGAPLARMVAEAGGDVLVSDLDQERAGALAEELGGDRVLPARVYETACDVYAPCAVGATLNSDTIPRLRCRLVAGSANNQLESPADARLLAEREILYAPDYVVNGGGALAFGLLHRGETDEGVLKDRIRGIGDRLADAFEEAEETGRNPLEVVQIQVARRLAEARETREVGGGVSS